MEKYFTLLCSDHLIIGGSPITFSQPAKVYLITSCNKYCTLVGIWHIHIFWTFDFSWTETWKVLCYIIFKFLTKNIS